MKHKPVILFFILLILFLPTSVRAEERNIYVGDLIELKINTSAYSLEELREKFDGFEIVALEQTPDGALITLRTFETGEKTVVLGDKQIVIRVQSTLDNYQREDVFEGDLNAQSPGFMPDWRIPAGLSALVFLLSGAFLVIKLFQKRKPVPPLERFIRAVSNVSLDSRDAPVQLTLCLKLYLEARFSVRIRGKTSGEIMKELSSLPDLQEKLPEIRPWLEKCDELKFSGKEASLDEKQALCTALKMLVERLEPTKEGKK